MTPLLSLVTGTYNRLSSLQRMINSARADLPRGIAYEIIVVDGGSTDGTLEWCHSQQDIRIIAHGELRGAIRAFCDGAKAATGDYVLLANDDVTFKPQSILAALAHLETVPTCGAVAFADNRTSLLTGNGDHYRVEGMGATTANGEKVMVAYAQVGLFRRELGNLAGWWGADDPIMGRARTYGGDNYLSSRLWEMGYSVDAVPLAQVEDYIERDPLRMQNANSGPQDSTLYYTRFPTVKIPALLKEYPIARRLRILHTPVYEWGYPGKANLEAALTEALVDYGLVAEIDYLNEDVDLIQVIAAWQPDLLITQIQGIGPKFTPYRLSAMRNAAPQMVIVNWNGDAHERGLTSPEMLDILRYVDIQTTINAKVLPVYQSLGIQAAYWQIGYKDPVEPIPDMPAYDVLFQGNCYDARRTQLIRALRALRKVKVGVYGNCENAEGNTHYSFAAQRGLYQKAKITIGDTFPGTQAFVSNRLFQALAAGAFLLQQHSEGLAEFTGLLPNIHYAEWTDNTDLMEKIRYYLKHPTERDCIARVGCAYVREHFSYAAQARKLFTDILPLLAREYEPA